MRLLHCVCHVHLHNKDVDMELCNTLTPIKLCYTDLYELMLLDQEFFFPKLLTFVPSVLNLYVLKLHYLLHDLIFSSLQENFSIYQLLNHLLLFLNYSNLLEHLQVC